MKRKLNREITEAQWFLDKDNPDKLLFHRVKKSILTTKTKYQSISILDTYNLGRMLITDGKIQSAGSDEYIYHESLVHPAMILHPSPLSVLILGGGEGATLREVVKYKMVKSIIMVDIDRELVEISKKYLKKWSNGAFQDKRVNIKYQGAIKYLRNTKKKFDVIITDISDPVPGGPAESFYTKAFDKLAYKRLNPDGIFVIQAEGLDYASYGDFNRSIYKTLKQVFPSVKPYYTYIPSFGSNWGFILAAKFKLPENFTLQEIKKLISSKKIKGLKYYSAETHIRIFSLPLDYNKYLK